MTDCKGVVKWYNQEKGYGFITTDDGKDIFVHHSQIKEKGSERDLTDGDHVSFDIVDGEKGPMSTNIRKL